jgi:hypothetical protein
MKGHTDVTIYELPPEPPVGSRVKGSGSIFRRNRDSRYGWDHEGDTSALSWVQVLRDYGPLTLIEPDPWPTAPLIVATLSSPSRSTKRLLLARNSNGDYVDGVRSALQEIDTLTNVIPVTVVPTAEWESLVLGRGHHKAGSVRDDYLLRRVDRIIIATDALGLDQ